MATYIIGDVHGCYTELQRLLELINFDQHHDRLGFTGDIVNRGPDSLAVLRFIKNLPGAQMVLGNHDFYLLILGYAAATYAHGHSLEAIFSAPDKLELLDWLRQQPLALYLQDFDTLLVHAGAPPQWKLKDILDKSQEISAQLRGPEFFKFLQNLEGDSPLSWQEQLAGVARYRYIVNSLTRMRFCTADGELNLTNKTARSTDPEKLRPWFEWYQLPQQVVFGHWAALEGHSNPRCQALDTGCVWGGALTAYRLEDSRRFQVPSLHIPSPSKGEG
jgi:bis(5'-nucleosyl)-tetraphosphatase (symmetrical)